MKTLRKNHLIPLAALLLAGTAFAGGASTGGGKGAVNPDTGELELLDLIEDHPDMKKGLEEVEVKDLQAYRVDLMSTLRDADNKVPGLSRQILAGTEKMNFAFTNGTVPPSHDECMNVTVDTQQLARQNGSTVVISRPLYDRLSAKSRAALLLHEILLWKEGQAPNLKTRKCTTLVREAVRAIFRPEASGELISSVYFEKLFEKKAPAGLLPKNKRRAVIQALKEGFLDRECRSVSSRLAFRKTENAEAAVSSFQKEEKQTKRYQLDFRATEARIHDLIGFEAKTELMSLLRIPHDQLPGPFPCLAMKRWAESDGSVDEILPEVTLLAEKISRKAQHEHHVACLSAGVCGRMEGGKIVTGKAAADAQRPLPKDLQDVDYDRLMGASEAR